MEFLEALSPTLLVLVIIKHFTVKFITKNKFQMPEKKEIVYEKHINFFINVMHAFCILFIRLSACFEFV